MRISDWSSDVCSSDLKSAWRWLPLLRREKPARRRPAAPVRSRPFLALRRRRASCRSSPPGCRQPCTSLLPARRISALSASISSPSAASSFPSSLFSRPPSFLLFLSPGLASSLDHTSLLHSLLL